MSARWLLGVALVLGCDLLGEPTPNVGTPNHHAAHGLEFDYPGNWKLEATVEDVDGIQLYSAELESPGNAMATVQQFKPGVPLGMDELMTEITSGLQEGAKQELGGMIEYIDNGATDVDRTILGEARKGREKRYTLGALGEKLAHTLQVYPVELEDRSLIIYMQIPDEDRAKVQPGFDQIYDTITLR